MQIIGLVVCQVQELLAENKTFSGFTIVIFLYASYLIPKVKFEMSVILTNEALVYAQFLVHFCFYWPTRLLQELWPNSYCRNMSE